MHAPGLGASGEKKNIKILHMYMYYIVFFFSETPSPCECMYHSMQFFSLLLVYLV